MAEYEYRILGQVRLQGVRNNAADLDVEIWDSDPVSDDLLVRARTDAAGRFRAQIRQSDYDEGLDEGVDLLFKVYRGTTQIFTTSGHVMRNLEAGDVVVELTVPAPAGDLPFPTMPLSTTSELAANTPDILARIATQANGGGLFLTHPLQCLADVGVSLDASLVTALAASHPGLLDCSLAAYQSLKEGKSQMEGQVILLGLFH